MNENSQLCPTVGSQNATVCLPVSVCPYAVAGPASIHCCGDAQISCGCEHCKGKVNGTCDFIITQTIRIDVPVEFGATVKVGDTFVDCCRPRAGFDEEEAEG